MKKRAESTRHLSEKRVTQILAAAPRTRVFVLGDVMLDQFVWGKVGRISPEAPVPVVEFERESFIPGGAANVARNLADLKVSTQIMGAVGHDDAAGRLKDLLRSNGIGCSGLLSYDGRATSVKTRIVAHRQQVVRIDRETRGDISPALTDELISALETNLKRADALIIGDYAKGTVTQRLLEEAKRICRARGVWLSVDPKPSHKLDLSGVSLLTPNRKEAFELAGVVDENAGEIPAQDPVLLGIADKLLHDLHPALLLITLGEQGILLCQRGQKPFHIATVAQEVFDVSGAGDTVIASFTFAIAAGASPIEAAIFSNHAAGVVVGKVGTATVQPEELLASFQW